MSEPVKLLVVIEGGSCTAVWSAGIPLDVVVLDFDNNDPEADDVQEVDTEGQICLASLNTLVADIDGPWVLKLHKQAKGE